MHVCIASFVIIGASVSECKMKRSMCHEFLTDQLPACETCEAAMKGMEIELPKLPRMEIRLQSE